MNLVSYHGGASFDKLRLFTARPAALVLRNCNMALSYDAEPTTAIWLNGVYVCNGDDLAGFVTPTLLCKDNWVTGLGDWQNFKDWKGSIEGSNLTSCTTVWSVELAF